MPKYVEVSGWIVLSEDARHARSDFFLEFIAPESFYR